MVHSPDMAHPYNLGVHALVALLAAGAVTLVSQAAQQAPLTVWDGVYTDAQAARGQAVFVRSCGGCHRDDMSGGDDSEPPLRGSHFSGKWEDAVVAELYDFIATSMPRNRPGSLPLQDCVDIVAFILKSNEMPPGSAELTTDIDRLAAIRFTATRPIP